MPWLWFAGPLTFLLLVVIFTVWPTAEERRVRRELRLWIEQMLGPLWDADDEEMPRFAAGLPPALAYAAEQSGGGTRIADIVLVPRSAYLAVRGADARTSTNHYTVTCKLAKSAPALEVKPLAIVDGRPVENDGIEFKDVDFMDHYVAYGNNTRAAKKWLTADVREALMEFPDLWLRTHGNTMSLSFYGAADADALDDLLEAADAIFAEYGADGGAPLFGDEDTWDFEEEPDEDADLDVEEGDETTEVLASKVDRITAGVIDWSLYGLGLVFLVAVLGYFPGFHPSWLFNSPDPVVTEPWQGGWTTKGFGALVIAETWLLGLLTWQAHLAVKSGQSIGKRLVGIEVMRVDGGENDFLKNVLLRSWIFALVPAIAAAVQARPFSARAFFGAIPTKITAAAALGVGLVLFVSWITSKTHRGLNDLLAGTEVVETRRYRIAPVQLDVPKNDPVVGRRAVYGACALVLFIGLNFVTLIRYDAWLLEIHQWWRETWLLSVVEWLT